ncbi:TPA: hypothetical protein ACVPL5_001331 [Yersinia enterocolitica]
MNNYLSLRGLFDSGELPTVVSDSSFLLNGFSSVGFKTLNIDDLCSDPSLGPKEVILVAAAPASHPNERLRDALRNSATLFIPLLAFAYDQRSISYLINRLLILDFLEACERSRRIVEFIQHIDEPIYVSSNGGNLTIELGDNVDVFAPKLVPKITIGESISIIQFLEVGLVPNKELTSFNVNGTFLCDGVSIAHHLHTHLQSGPIAEEAWRILNDVREKGGFPLTLHINNSAVSAIKTTDDLDLLPILMPLTDEMLRGQLTEVAFGSLTPSDETDWSINSQLNEPAGGVHIALGAGELGAHIDFVSPYAEILNIGH